MSPISVVISTRNRGAQAAEAARAVLRDTSEFDLLVVDQSTNEETAQALRTLEPERRLRVLRSPLRGLSVARNTGIAATTAPIIAFTDDDCRPDPGWVSAMLRVFADDPEAALVFGRVYLPPGARGYAASFEPDQRVYQGAIPLPNVSLGIGANFAVRREVVHALGGFDPMLGAGAPHFRGGEETDLLVRALHAGYRVINAAECSVLHLGVREDADIRALAIGYQLGTGAAFGKLSRLHGRSGLTSLARWAAFYGSDIMRDLVRLHRPHAGVLAYFLAGAALTFRYDIDRERMSLCARR